MKMKTMCIIGACLAIIGGVWHKQATIAFFGPALAGVIYMLHVLEVKVNRLLADRGITVSQEEIEE
ncbi:hypothetical protein GOD47_01385 [Sinorhizobium medicae]|nr:hypothetical protein [Sinorhizobium medicae]MDX0662677.1 hypothetical protein [Sinorhizobium medicae]MDX0723718.1 hypothetical protein [Sinorhizobium medicae]MDX0729802.1 hypothetical protein [Sinorhizobium medicae]MDX0809891.1 hypothetical protein [Sinorhizobium medicae]